MDLAFGGVGHVLRDIVPLCNICDIIFPPCPSFSFGVGRGHHRRSACAQRLLTAVQNVAEQCGAIAEFSRRSAKHCRTQDESVKIGPFDNRFCPAFGHESSQTPYRDPLGTILKIQGPLPKGSITPLQTSRRLSPQRHAEVEVGHCHAAQSNRQKIWKFFSKLDPHFLANPTRGQKRGSQGPPQGTISLPDALRWDFGDFHVGRAQWAP